MTGRGLEHCLNLIVNVLGSESEFLVKHLVRSGIAEGFETEYLAVRAYEALEVYRKTCGESEDLGSVREKIVLVLCRLGAEEAL